MALRQKKVDGWYVAKGYPHFDLPLPFKVAARYVTDPKSVARHAFLPFLGYDQITRKYRTEKVWVTNIDGTVTRTKKRLPCDPKRRPLRITPHVDGYIYAYYAKILSAHYEHLIRSANIGRHIIAYRTGLGTNVNFAKAAFDVVSSRGDCVAVAFDLSKFFDSIDHGVLKTQWARVLGVSRLPEDHHNVYRAITRYSVVNMGDCLSRLGINRKGRTAEQRLCNATDFRKIVRGTKPSLVFPNLDAFGIPQGSPISALLSNIAMLPFDEAMHGLCDQHSWNYLRYCDDILVIGNPGEIDKIKSAVVREIAKLGGSLAINDSKTECFEFIERDGVRTVIPQLGRTVALPLQYLGFTFDGARIRVRSSSLSKYWRKLIRGARGTRIRAKRRASKGGTATLIKRRVYEDVTHLGGRNFVSYVKRAQGVFGLSKLGRPLRKHFDRLQRELSK